MNFEQFANQRLDQDPNVSYEQVQAEFDNQFGQVPAEQEQEQEQVEQDPYASVWSDEPSDYVPQNSGLLEDWGSSISGGTTGSMAESLSFFKSFAPESAQAWMDENLGWEDSLRKSAEESFMEMTDESKRVMTDVKFLDPKTHSGTGGDLVRKASLIGAGAGGSLANMALTGGPAKAIFQAVGKKLVKKYGDNPSIIDEVSRLRNKFMDKKTGKLKKGISQKDLEKLGAESVIAKKAAKMDKVKEHAGDAAYALAGGAMSGGSAYNEVKDAINDKEVTSDEVLLEHPEFQKLVKQYGGDLDVAREIFAADQAKSARNLSAISAAPLGAMTGRIMNGIFKYSGKSFTRKNLENAGKSFIVEGTQGGTEALISREHIPGGGGIDVYERGLEEGIGGTVSTTAISVPVTSVQKLGEIASHSADHVFDRTKQFVKSASPLADEQNIGGIEEQSSLKNITTSIYNGVLGAKIIAGNKLSEADRYLFGQIPAKERAEVLAKAAMKKAVIAKNIAGDAVKDQVEKFDQVATDARAASEAFLQKAKEAEKVNNADAQAFYNSAARKAQEARTADENISILLGQVGDDLGSVYNSTTEELKRMKDYAAKGDLTDDTKKWFDEQIKSAESYIEKEKTRMHQKDVMSGFYAGKPNAFFNEKSKKEFEKQATEWMNSNDITRVKTDKIHKEFQNLLDGIDQKADQFQDSTTEKVVKASAKKGKQLVNKLILKAKRWANDVKKGKVKDSEGHNIASFSSLSTRLQKQKEDPNITLDPEHAKLGKMIKDAAPEVYKALEDNDLNNPVLDAFKKDKEVFYGDKDYKVDEGLIIATSSTGKLSIAGSKRVVKRELNQLFKDTKRILKTDKVKVGNVEYASVDEFIKDNLVDEDIDALGNLNSNDFSRLSLNDIRLGNFHTSKYTESTKEIPADLYTIMKGSAIEEENPSFADDRANRVWGKMFPAEREKLRSGKMTKPQFAKIMKRDELVGEDVGQVRSILGNISKSVEPKHFKPIIPHQKIIAEAYNHLFEKGQKDPTLQSVYTHMNTMKKKIKGPGSRKAKGNMDKAMFDLNELIHGIAKEDRQAFSKAMAKIHEEYGMEVDYDKVYEQMFPESGVEQREALSRGTPMKLSDDNSANDTETYDARNEGEVETKAPQSDASKELFKYLEEGIAWIPGEPKVTFLMSEIKGESVSFLDTNNAELLAELGGEQNGQVGKPKAEKYLEELKKDEHKRTFTLVRLDKAVKAIANQESWEAAYVAQKVVNSTRRLAPYPTIELARADHTYMRYLLSQHKGDNAAANKDLENKFRFQKAVKKLYDQYLIDSKGDVDTANLKLLSLFQTIRIEDKSMVAEPSFDNMDKMGLGQNTALMKREDGKDIPGAALIRHRGVESDRVTTGDVRLRTPLRLGFIPLVNSDKVLNLPRAISVRHEEMGIDTTSIGEAIQSVLTEYAGELDITEEQFLEMPTQVEYNQKTGTPFPLKNSYVNVVAQGVSIISNKKVSQHLAQFNKRFNRASPKQKAKYEAKMQEIQVINAKLLGGETRVTSKEMDLLHKSKVKLRAEAHEALGIKESYAITEYKKVVLGEEISDLRSQIKTAESVPQKRKLEKELKSKQTEKSELRSFSTDQETVDAMRRYSAEALVNDYVNSGGNMPTQMDWLFYSDIMSENINETKEELAKFDQKEVIEARKTRKALRTKEQSVLLEEYDKAIDELSHFEYAVAQAEVANKDAESFFSDSIEEPIAQGIAAQNKMVDPDTGEQITKPAAERSGVYSVDEIDPLRATPVNSETNETTKAIKKQRIKLARLKKKRLELRKTANRTEEQNVELSQLETDISTIQEVQDRPSKISDENLALRQELKDKLDSVYNLLEEKKEDGFTDKELLSLGKERKSLIKSLADLESTIQEEIADHNKKPLGDQTLTEEAAELKAIKDKILSLKTKISKEQARLLNAKSKIQTSIHKKKETLAKVEEGKANKKANKDAQSEEVADYISELEASSKAISEAIANVDPAKIQQEIEVLEQDLTVEERAELAPWKSELTNLIKKQTDLETKHEHLKEKRSAREDNDRLNEVNKVGKLIDATMKDDSKRKDKEEHPLDQIKYPTSYITSTGKLITQGERTAKDELLDLAYRRDRINELINCIRGK